MNKKSTINKKLPLPIVLVLILIISLVIGASYMSVNSQCIHLGKKITMQEKQISSIKNRLIINNQKWSSMTSPVNLERAINYHELNMVMPNNKQVIRVEKWDQKKGLAISKINNNY